MITTQEDIKALEGKGIFFIPAGHEFGVSDDKAVQLVYAPLAGRSFLVKGNEVPAMQKKLRSLLEAGIDVTPEKEPLSVLFAEESLQKWLNYAIEPEDCQNLTILPNHRCNFNCTYCYSAGGRSGAELRSEQIIALATWTLKNCAQKKQSCRILFLGGGEPLLSWDIMKDSIQKIQAISKELGAEVVFSASTNGSLLTADKIEFIRENNISLQVSFEVLEDIQNLQRGHYDLVHNNVCAALDAGIALGLHSVITTENVDRMVEVVQCAHERYPSLPKLGLEPVVDNETLPDSASAAQFYNRYYDNYLEAEKLCREYGIELLNANSKNTDQVRTHYCAGQIVLTPQGTFSACEAISSPKEAGYNEFIFGKVNENNEITFDEEAFRRIRPPHPGFCRDKCDSCWARWICGGGCAYKRRTLPPDVFDEYCNLSRRMMLHTLANKLRAEHNRTTTGDSLDDIVKKLFGK